MKTSTVEALVWVLIYGGLLVAGLGWSVQRRGSLIGHVLVVGGGVVAAAGVVLIYVRSRMKDKP